MNENECEADPCHADADCTDTAGGFVCRCRDGYEGSGLQCQGVCSLVGSSFITHCACKTIEIYGCDGIVQTELIQLGHYHLDRKSTRLNSSHVKRSRMPSSA